MKQSPTIGLIGCGLMGKAMASRLIAGGAQVWGYDPQGVEEEGIEVCASLADLAGVCEWILYSLPNSKVALEVTDELLPHLTPKHAVADTTTGQPQEMEAMARTLGAHHIVYLEANVAGSSELLAQGKATLFLGGDQATLDRWDPILALLCEHRRVIGMVGAASRFKLVHNLMIGLHRAALAEGLHFASTMGFDPKEALAILKQTPACSEVMHLKGKRMVERAYEPPQARLSQHLKDVELMLQMGSEQGVELPLSQVHRMLLLKAQALGLGEADNSAIAEVYRSSKDPKG